MKTGMGNLDKSVIGVQALSVYLFMPKKGKCKKQQKIAELSVNYESI